MHPGQPVPLTFFPQFRNYLHVFFGKVSPQHEILDPPLVHSIRQRIHQNEETRILVADPRGRQGRAHSPPRPGGPNSFIFMQFSAKNSKIIALLGVGAPPSGKSWIRH